MTVHSSIRRHLGHSLVLTLAIACRFAAPFSSYPIRTAAIRCTHRHRSSPASSIFSSISAQDLLYQDQQDAMLRRALHEEELLSRNKSTKELLAPKLKAQPKSGTGFATKTNPLVSLAEAQAKVVRKEGLVRIDNVLTADVADSLREYVLEQQRIAKIETDRDASLSQIYYGVENRRKSRCDLQLSLLRGGYAADRRTPEGEEPAVYETFPLADALQQLLGEEGTLRHLYENLVTMEGEFYELAAVITDPGSNRQTVHPDLPFQEKAPLYVIFLALQDVTVQMGPTSFLMGTHTSKCNDIFNCGGASQKDELILKSECRLSTLKKGDAVLFDARTLHCGNANDSESTRALFNFSFRNAAVKGDLGYKGSIRPGYEKAMKLKDMSEALLAYGAGDENPFAKFGNGMFKRGY